MNAFPTDREERMIAMANNPGSFPAINKEMCETLEDITNRGNDAEVRKRYDGTYDVFELEKKRPKSPKAD